LNDTYLQEAVGQIPDRMVLVKIASERAKELARGAAPMVVVSHDERTNYLDIALKEIAEEKLVVDEDSLA
jgi:DNA-directed RNA polymerase omega subunit